MKKASINLGRTLFTLSLMVSGLWGCAEKSWADSSSSGRNSRGAQNIFELQPAPNTFFDNGDSPRSRRIIPVIMNDKEESEEIAPRAEEEQDKNPLVAPPEQSDPVRARTHFNFDPGTPQQFRKMVESIQDGDYLSAKESASEFVDYLSELMYMVREVTHLIVQTMVERGEMDDEELRGAEQLLDWQMATARQKSGIAVKPTHNLSLQRIKKPDTAGKAEVYFYFTLNCRYCRDMAPDVERLARALKGDSRVRVSAPILGSPPQDLIASFKDYTGLTSVPIIPGDSSAKALRLAFLPALVVVSPTNGISYLRTGQMTFENMYEFVRAVQGLPKEMDIKTAQLRQVKIGEIERIKDPKGTGYTHTDYSQSENKMEPVKIELSSF